jgi:hypothetical protein
MNLGLGSDLSERGKWELDSILRLVGDLLAREFVLQEAGGLAS